jgi:hypothetical protein
LPRMASRLRSSGVGIVAGLREAKVAGRVDVVELVREREVRAALVRRGRAAGESVRASELPWL